MSLEEEYQKIQDELQTSFDSGVTLPYEYRIGQLKKCAAMIKAMEKVRLNQFRSLSNILLRLGGGGGGPTTFLYMAAILTGKNLHIINLGMKECF